ncbi:MAG: UDP-glucose 4-epimerase GalE [Pseudorhodoplanes sp.]|nr:UDP-glucose 4-epimerase [Pseudorhodoplanes sp.]MCL4710326.1 UDP-glucose 4-epimerase GalE [Pseudorhodoplanes sp.]
MCIMVTGGCGYIGSHMVHELVDAGEQVIVLDDLSTGFRSAIPQSVPLYVGNTGDVGLTGALIGAHRVNAIIHFAASIVVPESVRDPLYYYHNNTMNTRSLLESAIKGGVKHFIFSSTAAVYGNPDRIPVAEDAQTHPMSPYGASKLMSEIMLHDVAAAHGLKYAVLRYFNVAGADPAGRTGQMTVGATHLIKVGVEAALGLRAKLDVYGTNYPTPDGTCIRDYIHVSDLARAHSMALAHLRRGGRSMTVNCGYGHGYSVLEVIEAVKQVSGRNFAVAYAERRPGDPAAIVADSAKIRAAFGWAPQFDDLPTIVGHALAWEAKLAAERALPLAAQA